MSEIQRKWKESLLKELDELEKKINELAKSKPKDKELERKWVWESGFYDLIARRDKIHEELEKIYERKWGKEVE